MSETSRKQRVTFTHIIRSVPHISCENINNTARIIATILHFPAYAYSDSACSSPPPTQAHSLCKCRMADGGFADVNNPRPDAPLPTSQVHIGPTTAWPCDVLLTIRMYPVLLWPVCRSGPLTVAPR